MIAGLTVRVALCLPIVLADKTYKKRSTQGTGRHDGRGQRDGAVAALDGFVKTPGLPSAIIAGLVVLTTVGVVAPQHDMPNRAARHSRRGRKICHATQARTDRHQVYARHAAKDASLCWTYSSAVPVTLVLGFHAAGWLAGNVAIDTVQTLAQLSSSGHTARAAATLTAVSGNH